MSWPGSQLPPGAARRRAKGGKPRKRPSSLEQVIRQAAIKAGVFKPQRPTETGACLAHCFEALGFASAWDLAKYLAAIARPGSKRVRIPRIKVPHAYAGAWGVRCRQCAGTGGTGNCACESFGWGVRWVARKNCQHVRQQAAA